MSRRSLEMIGVASAMMAVVALLPLGAVRVAAQAPTSRATTGTAEKAADTAPKTALGRPGLAGHLDLRETDTVATTHCVRRQGVFHR